MPTKSQELNFKFYLNLIDLNLNLVAHGHKTGQIAIEGTEVIKPKIHFLCIPLQLSVAMYHDYN